MDLYYIKEGNITELPWNYYIIKKLSDTCNWEDEALIYAESEEEALELADMYDDGLIEQDNVIIDGYGCIIALEPRG